MVSARTIVTPPTSGMCIIQSTIAMHPNDNRAMQHRGEVLHSGYSILSHNNIIFVQSVSFLAVYNVVIVFILLLQKGKTSLQ